MTEKIILLILDTVLRELGPNLKTKEGATMMHQQILTECFMLMIMSS